MQPTPRIYSADYPPRISNSIRHHFTKNISYDQNVKLYGPLFYSKLGVVGYLSQEGVWREIE
jgi:hypothetical protein